MAALFIAPREDSGAGKAAARSLLVQNFLILRASPDWMNFDVESSRGFLRSVGLPEDLIIEFSALWNRRFKTDYCSVRAQLKALALETYSKVQHATFLRHEAWDENAWDDTNDPPGWVAFVDDDDWMSPGLFGRLPETACGDEGVRWGSLRLGRVFTTHGYAEPIIQRRALNRVVYTNNYAVTSRALRRLGHAALFEHTAAQHAFDRPDFALNTCDEYLSCAVKHPCCTVSAAYLMSLEGFRLDPTQEMSIFLNALSAVCLGGIEEWLRKPFTRFREVMTDAVQPR